MTTFTSAIAESMVRRLVATTMSPTFGCQNRRDWRARQNRSSANAARTMLLTRSTPAASGQSA